MNQSLVSLLLAASFLCIAAEGGPPDTPSPGSIYTASGLLANLGRDLRASQIGDIVTVVISEKASASARGATNSSRKSSLDAKISAMGGPLRATGPSTNLASLSGDQKLQGQGETSRETEMTTTLSTRVVEVLPGGNLVLEGAKEILVNSERQKVVLHGIARWSDLTSSNRILSERLADLTVRIEGKGVVHDAIRRPNFLYRLLLGLLPF